MSRPVQTVCDSDEDGATHEQPSRDSMIRRQSSPVDTHNARPRLRGQGALLEEVAPRLDVETPLSPSVP